jgi:hypothetical protein
MTRILLNDLVENSHLCLAFFDNDVKLPQVHLAVVGQHAFDTLCSETDTHMPVVSNSQTWYELHRHA